IKNQTPKISTTMNEMYVKLRRNLGLSMILVIGTGVEFTNFQSMFFKFMLAYRPDWGHFNHLPAGFLSAFLLLCIVIFGIRKQTGLSWFLALLTCIISFSVYARMNIDWQWETMNEIHMVILILSGMLPLLVAYTTHQIAHDNENEFDELDEDYVEQKSRRSPSSRSLKSAVYEEPKKKQLPAKPRKSELEEEEEEIYQRLRGKYGVGEVKQPRQQPPTYHEEGYHYDQQSPNGPYPPQTQQPNGYNGYQGQNGHSFKPQNGQFYGPQNGPVPQSPAPMNPIGFKSYNRSAVPVAEPTKAQKRAANELKYWANQNGVTTNGQTSLFPPPSLNQGGMAYQRPATTVANLRPTPKVTAQPPAFAPKVEEEAGLQRTGPLGQGREVTFTVNRNPHPQEPEAMKVPGGYLIKCANCGQEGIRKTKTAKYCSEECRHEANKHHLGGLSTHPQAREGNLHIVRDDYDTEGIMEWKL
ncbi:MAG: zinc finger MYND domain-containing protein, partial [Bernardetiaceae bacterium]|nr:zinc finger MYND domain-containing protein [Bernardetiaceae bacterium]